MRHALSLTLPVVAVVLIDWVVLNPAEDGSAGLQTLQKARAEGRTARYLDVRSSSCCDRAGRRQSQRMQFGPRQYVYSLNGRITGWQRGQVSYGLKESLGCYERRGESDFAGVREMRRDLVVPRAFVHEADLVESGHQTIIRWRSPPLEQGHVSGTLRLDRAGRAVLKRERLVIRNRPARAVSVWHYRYPTRNSMGAPPGPRCPQP